VTERHVAEDAIAYLSGQLPRERRAAVEAHLSKCEQCRSEYDTVGVALAALADWPRDPQLPLRLEDRLLSAVRRRRPGPWARRIAAVLALALVGGGGFAAGRATVPGPNVPVTAGSDTTLGTYLLLLEEQEWPQRRPSGRQGYTAWAQALRAEHRLVSAEKLTDESGFRIQPTGRVLRPEESGCPANVSGWFLLRARTYDDAIALARRGPHLRYGSVLVRQVE
jgi:Putative zinc-finger